MTALFQPIEALQTGKCQGFEALARLRYESELLPPERFLPYLESDDRLSLFAAMLGQSIGFLKDQAGYPELFVSINVEISLLIGEDFVDVLEYFLERYDFAGERLVLELLENEDVHDLPKLNQTINAIKALGLKIALDDIGSAYASLTKLKTLSVDIIKLDRGFSRDLDRQPEGLMFVLSMLSLAAGLGKRMVVEGIESEEVYDALRIMGCDYGQGYAIARPMPAAAVGEWLSSRASREKSRVPRSLLGAYASHFTIVEGCRALNNQPLPIAWTASAGDHRQCVIGKLFEDRGWHETAFGKAHREFHRILPLYETDPDVWTNIASLFQMTMAAAMAADPIGTGCGSPYAGEDPIDCACVTTPRLGRKRAPIKRQRFVASR